MSAAIAVYESKDAIACCHVVTDVMRKGALPYQTNGP
jgi:hypothetical protein